jgi:hypothetical protein
MSSEAPRNSYLDQVVAQQQRLEVDLKAKRAPMNQLAAPPAAMRQARGRSDTGEVQLASIEGAIRAQGGGPAPSNAVEVRVTGLGPWKTVIVPPNAYVVHTRRGHAEPLHLGLGVSFRFNQYVDTYLAVPGAMQTIVINAHCICKELQGLLVQGYVQWIIQDFGTAYKKLDFGDAEDPMRLVNLQLREQAEAAIKDKVATMSIDDVLSDKQPIIAELTARLRHVAEGEGSSDKGLGLRIVTVQIKEAVVSSARLWDNLQKPFRAQRAKVARLAELESEEVISAREAVSQKVRETTQMETERELSTVRARNEAETHDREQAERLRRSQQEQTDALALAQAQQATALKKVALEMARVAAEAEAATLKLSTKHALERLQADAQSALELLRADTESRKAALEVATLGAREEVQNRISPSNLQARIIQSLPQVMEKMPKPDELRSVTIGGSGGTDGQSLAGVVAQVVSVVNALQGVGKNGAPKP